MVYVDGKVYDDSINDIATNDIKSITVHRDDPTNPFGTVLYIELK